MDHVIWSSFSQLDRVRRMQGRVLDAAGLRPAETPYRLIHDQPGVALRCYGSGREDGPAVLIVPAPIKRPYIWDLSPEVSVVRRCLARGTRVYLADWQPAPPSFGLAHYAERMILGCLAAARIRRAVLLGHSLGGLFATIFATLHPERMQGLGLIASPLHFGAATPVFRSMATRLDPDALPESIPGSFFTARSVDAAPEVYAVDPLLDAMLSAGDPARLRIHWLVRRWTLDEFALPRRLVGELANAIVREDRFARGTLKIGRRRAEPGNLTAPLLAVIDWRCRVVPPGSVLPFIEAAASRSKTLLRYEGDFGVALQHVGPLVGRNAHALLWPRILDWVSEIGGDRNRTHAARGTRMTHNS